MGLLVDGQPLPPEDLKVVNAYIRQHGVQQFINTWRRLKNVQNDELKFGDEIECGIFAVDSEKRTAKLSIRGAEVYLSIHMIRVNKHFSYVFLA
jgi:glutamate--cysteine ligase catalytic subunit